MKLLTFESLWPQLKNHLRSGGIFAGHLFGIHHTVIAKKDRETMVFFDKKAVEELLEDFEVFYFQERDKDRIRNNEMLRSHDFEIIARKT